ncbi:8-oxo-dGTP diphosphatase [Agrococcus baldri]|uniref:8-oxo-dGTP diphosphatase n=1 Tax=Agrococcus baldri TaxID=153730 RepID=A0AA94KYR2_9MICO|nr:NUDIX domain-containing protein [Agrococcus baldri]SFS01443.1 8-oxo-dGTP diphosphatase [Agrococcus baldri]
MSANRPPVLAAGALVWREVGGKVQVLLVERTQHRDHSLPKGKLDPGETLPECAAREIEEETGLTISLGAPLGTTEYRLPDGRDKVVYYWQAKVDDDAVSAAAFSPNDEILALEWLPLAKAKRRCTYEHDVTVIERFEERLAAGHAETFPIIAQRHAKAADPFSWEGSDASRTLTSRGERQARLVAGGIAAFAPERIITSNAVRCMQTVAPLRQLLGIEPKVSSAISQEAHDHPELHPRDEVERRVGKAVRKRRGIVLCSHAPVIPEIVTAVVHATDALESQRTHRASMLHTAEFTVLHVSAGETPALVALETHSPRER